MSAALGGGNIIDIRIDIFLFAIHILHSNFGNNPVLLSFKVNRQRMNRSFILIHIYQKVYNAAHITVLELLWLCFTKISQSNGNSFYQKSQFP